MIDRLRGKTEVSLNSRESRGVEPRPTLRDEELSAKGEAEYKTDVL